MSAKATGHAAIRELFGVSQGVSPRWMIDRLPEQETSLGTRVMCRCCGFLTLPNYGNYVNCPVCGGRTIRPRSLSPASEVVQGRIT